MFLERIARDRKIRGKSEARDISVVSGINRDAISRL